jgi:hypothetical protein
LYDIVNEPPYFGVPRLSHQFPVEVVFTAVVAVPVVVVDVVLTTVDVVVVVVDVVVVFVVVALVVVEEPQDAKSSDATRRRLTVIQITPFFI